MRSILLIDDDDQLGPPLAEYFARFDFRLDTATHPRDGLHKLDSQRYELVILDVMLPDMDGFEVCRRIRESSSIPVVMLTARGEVNDRVEGLELGADDYLAKPFEPRELVARIQNILRRAEVPGRRDGVYEFEDLVLDPARQQVSVAGEAVNLTTSEYQLLLLFAENAGQELSRDDISTILRGADVELFSRAVDIQVSRLRSKLKPTDYIKTVWGSGYQFVAPSVNDSDA